MWLEERGGASVSNYLSRRNQGRTGLYALIMMQRRMMIPTMMMILDE